MPGDHAPPPLETLVANRPRAAPVRYPAVGFGLVGSFVLLCVVLTMMRGGAEIPALVPTPDASTADLDFQALPVEVQHAAKAARSKPASGHGEPREAAGRDAGAAPDVRWPDTKDLAKGLTKTLRDVLDILSLAGHDPTLVADAVWRSRHRLESMDARLHDYQTTKRSPATEDAAKAFAQQIDQARGRLQHAASELDRAKLASMDGVEGESPFKTADEILAHAKDEATAAEALLGQAP